MSEENPLTKKASLEIIAERCSSSILSSKEDTHRLVLDACFYAKAQGIDECMDLIDSMLNSDTSQLTRNEKTCYFEHLIT